jgi:hypothetical protein
MVDLAVTPDTAYLILGTTVSFGAGGDDYYLIKTEEDEEIISGSDHVSLIPSAASICAFPNPFNPFTEIQLNLVRQMRTGVEIVDLLGRQITTLHDGMLEPGEHRFTFDASALPSGIYFARVQAGEFVKTQKLLLLK